MTAAKEINAHSVRDVGTIGRILDEEVDKLVKATEPDAQRLFSRVVDRLREAREAFIRIGVVESDNRDRYADAIKQLVMLLVPYATQILAGRVIQHLKLEKALRKIHETLDLVYSVLRLHDKSLEETTGNWLDALNNDDMPAHIVALKTLVESPEVRSEIEGDNALFQETMILLNEAKGSLDSDKWNLLTTRFYGIAQGFEVSSELRTEAEAQIPRWFVPLTDVMYGSKPFASGSFGAVHRGVWGSGTPVVVKILNEGDRLGAELLQSFFKEADLWGLFTHPNCVRMFGACHVSSPPFIICEDATNGNLRDYLAEMTDGESHRRTQIWRRLFEASLGLEYLHNKEVIHRDLKLDNVLVGSDGFARVSDFGLSSFKKDSKDQSASKDGNVKSGALRWRPPELVDPSTEADLHDELAADVYSFGMCIYEALAGAAPYALDTDEDAKAKIQIGELPERPELTSDEAWNLVLEMTKHDPAQRMKLKDVIANLKKMAEDEFDVELSKYVVCELCNTHIKVTSSNYCRTCGVNVKTKSAENATIRIRSVHDLAAAINLLSIGTFTQKEGAVTALVDYVFGEPIHQERAHDAGAIPILVKLLNDLMERAGSYLKRDTKESKLLVNALVALGSIYTLNELNQSTAAYEGAISVLQKALARRNSEESDPRRQAKAAMSVGLLVDNHAANRAKIPVEVVAVIQNLRRGPSSTVTTAAERALKKLNSVQKNEAGVAA